MEIKKSIWDAWLDAELNERYIAHFKRSYYQRDKYTKIFLAVMTSGTVASWGIWGDIQLLWKILSALTAVTAIALPFFKLENAIEKLSNNIGRWKQIRTKYEMLYLSRENKSNDDLIREYGEIKNKEHEIEEDNLPNKKNLIIKIQNEIIVSKGLNH